jgi:hypothetical protein
METPFGCPQFSRSYLPALNRFSASCQFTTFHHELM